MVLGVKPLIFAWKLPVPDIGEIVAVITLPYKEVTPYWNETPTLVADPKLLKLPLMVAEVESLLVAALVLTVGFSVTIE